MSKSEKALEELNFKELGLKVGIEIHQQLNSKEKLFCHCLNQLQIAGEPDFLLERRHRPVLGQDGKFDVASCLNSKNKTVIFRYNAQHV